MPQVPPRDLYPTSDIRFVLVEISKLSTQVQRLIEDVKDQGTCLDDIKHKVTFIKGAAWVGGLMLVVFFTMVGFFVSANWGAFMAILKAANAAATKP